MSKRKSFFGAVNLTALVLAAGLLMGLFTGCPQKIEPKNEVKPEPAKITITVKADDGYTLTEPANFEVVSGSTWAAIKEKAEKKAALKDGHSKLGWKLGGKDGGYLTDKTIFNENKTVFAVSKTKDAPNPEKITITVLGDEGVKVASDNTFTADKGVKWENIKESAKSKITVKENYELAEWYLNDKTGAILKDDRTFTSNTKVFAITTPKGSPAPQTANYTVEHWQQNIANDGYTKVETETLSGIVEENTQAQAKSYKGFTAKEPIAQTKIKEDGSTVVKIEYDRNTITLTLDLAGGSITTPLEDGEGGKKLLKGKFEADVTDPAPTRPGYNFKGWNPELPQKFPAENSAHTAQWAKENDYTITYHLNGGTDNGGNPVSYNVETETINLKPAIRAGYNFEGWYTNEGLTEGPVTKIEKGSTGNKEFWAKWTAKTDTPYKVEHWQQNIADDGYTKVEADTQTLTGTTDTQTNAQAKTYEGFRSLGISQQTIKADGSTIVQVKYDRKIISLTLNLDGGTVSPPLTEGKIKGRFGASVTAPVPTKQGYTFDKWEPALPTVFPAENSEYTSKWTAGTVSYKVEHWQQNIADDGYTKVEADTQTLTGTTGTQTNAQAKTYPGFNALPVSQTAISADGTTVVQIKYDRKEITLTLDLQGGSTSTHLEDGEGSKKLLKGLFGAAVNVADPAKEGFGFVKWEPELPKTFPENDPAETYTAQWTDKYKIIIKGDERTKISEEAFVEIPFNKTWADIKDQAAAKVSFGPGWDNGDYEVYEWRIDNETGEKLTDSYPITKDITVYAVTNYAKFNIKDNKITGYGYKGGKPRGKIIIPDGITEMENLYGRLFSDCKEITSVRFPKSLTKIGSRAFSGCTGLKNLDLSSCTSLTTIDYDAFSGCTGKINLDISSCTSLTTIRSKAFADFTGLTSITLPKSLTTIGSSAFGGCTGLESIDLSSCTSLTTIGSHAFEGCTGKINLDLSSCTSLTTIGSQAFADFTGLTSITLPKNLTTIGSSAFGGCTGLESINLSSCTSLTTIGYVAFSGCTDLKNVNLSSCTSLTKIDYGAFQECTDLENVNLSGCTKLTKIDEWTFFRCTRLTSITLPANLNVIAGYAFKKCNNLKSISLPEKLTIIGDETFGDCTGLENVDLSSCKELTLIAGSFSGCGNLKNVDLSYCEKLNIISSNSFKDCTGLTSISFPASLTKIRSNAFSGCTKLTTATFADKNGWAVYDFLDYSGTPTPIQESDLKDAAKAAEYLRRTYVNKHWKKN
ncbi:leucine-rich repeat protein [Treponema sp. OMZ 787]|uniref:leucine-rich repeat protein n=1 Tax=Treponema sp. OMZ 787 TaxID=2563669 RepID=UPI0020A36E04|nr:leucine-rich repeat protein [Treponema sp. OMZ 787]UTC62392.1 leucine-rich repeat protein [Treponema sp. OMZ 787]